MHRRDAVVALTALSLAPVLPVAVAPAVAQDTALPSTPEEAAMVTDDDLVLGDADAPVTIIAYESLTCSYCASFHADTLPALKQHYIDTGKARLVFRDFPLDPVSLRAAMLVRCADPDRAFGLLEVLFRSQSSWARSSDPVQALGKVGQMAGIDQATFKRCMADETVMNGVLTRRLVGSKQFSVQSTPTFIINGGEATLVGAKPFADFDKTLKPLVD